MTKLLLDANTVMEASRQYYAFDTAPGFWAWLSDPALHSLVGSIDAIRKEISSGTGALVTWSKTLPASFWVPDHANVPASIGSAVAWVSDPSRPYIPAAVSAFAASADLRLIAQAHASGGTVVTREVSAPAARKIVKIPDVCTALGVRCVQPFEAYRELGMRLT